MDLIASRSVEGYPSLQIPVTQIYYRLDEAALLDVNFRNAIQTSLQGSGLLWPIIVKPIIDDKYWCWLGNNRLYFAETNCYHTISCIICTDLADRNTIKDITAMEYGVEF